MSKKTKKKIKKFMIQQFNVKFKKKEVMFNSGGFFLSFENQKAYRLNSF